MDGTELESAKGKPTIRSKVRLERVKGGWVHAASIQTNEDPPVLSKRKVREQAFVFGSIEMYLPSLFLRLKLNQPVEVSAFHGKSGELRTERWLRLPDEVRALPSGDRTLAPVQITRTDTQRQKTVSVAYVDPRDGRLLEYGLGSRSPVKIYAIKAEEIGKDLP